MNKEQNSFANKNQNTDANNVPQHIKNLCDSSNEATCVIDCDGNFIYANKHIEYFYSIDIKNIIHTHVLKNPLRNKFNTDESLLATGTIGLDAMFYKRPIQHFGLYDKQKLVLLSAFPYFDFESDKHYVFIQHTHIDPLQKVLLENYQQALRYNVNSVNEGIAGFPSSIIAADLTMRDLLQKLARVAKKDSSVLLRGETGVGKEVLARGIHSVSSRCDGPFIPVNCGSIPPELFEAEFFGYEKGAFTSAVHSKPGYFEMANCGTIFLDELGELPLHFQVKLLRVLEAKECMRLGGKKVQKLDFRIIAATNKDLEAAVADGTFRSDLYYRLNVLEVVIPPLRSRKKDIPPLAKSFLDYFNRKEKLNKQLSNAACTVLMNYDWPGNIRELRNVIERCVALSENDIIEDTDLELFDKNEIRSVSQDKDLASLVTEYETTIINERIAACGSIRGASRSLGVSHATLLRKLKKSEDNPK